MIPNMYYIIKTMNHLQFGCFIVSFIALILIMCFVDLMKFIYAYLQMGIDWRKSIQNGWEDYKKFMLGIGEDE